ncbi:hypothetical protein AQUCO_03400058v1 [Aquilegia coerulea]|uniref:Uncharacterized protein n=1 Tax=Aquilegia coerulea TaxID=218851 RepID=A0A2G5CXB3_AQUCA|nr:hypothetical protein AQUCO_03400058v1 [Aquilegia coerulea]
MVLKNKLPFLDHFMISATRYRIPGFFIFFFYQTYTQICLGTNFFVSMKWYQYQRQGSNNNSIRDKLISNWEQFFYSNLHSSG